MTPSTDDFVAALSASASSVRAVVDDHLLEYGGESLLHLLVADVRLWCIEAFLAGERSDLGRCLDVMAMGILSSDDYVQNAVAVSFVEDTPWFDQSMEPFMAVWPAPLQAEADRQREWYEESH